MPSKSSRHAGPREAAAFMTSVGYVARLVDGSGTRRDDLARELLDVGLKASLLGREL